MDTNFELLDKDTGGSNERGLDDNESVSQSEEQGFEEQSLGEAAQLVQLTKKEAEDFTVKEDNLLVSAWLGTSMDAVQESEQSCGTYWQRIHDYFHAHKDFESDRNVDCLMHRWNVIQESVKRYCQGYAQIQSKWESLITEQDKVLKACQLYMEKDKHGKSFDFLHCWSILRFEEKWNDRSSLHETMSISSQGSCTSRTNGSYNDDDEDDDSKMKRRRRTTVMTMMRRRG